MWRSWRRAEKIALILLLMLGGLALISLRASYPAEPEPVYFVESKAPLVALTFDALWSGENLEEILGLLEREAVRATFFLSGTWLQNHPEKAALILSGGHEIGNKTMSQRILTALDQQELVQEIKGFNDLAAQILEYRPRLFRPPLGLYNGMVLKKARQQGCTTILWSIDSYDWISLNSAEIVEKVAGAVHPGAIIVFHLEAPLLPRALPEILKLLREGGFKPCMVSELLQAEEQG